MHAETVFIYFFIILQQRSSVVNIWKNDLLDVRNRFFYSTFTSVISSIVLLREHILQR